ncbi:DUF3732 domain-containing protein [Cellulomonas sp. P24]|uniref:DUF3732 domain-containing protein n=1 Tax=Cellulomonas sp. P24 TaxID=2885206 RepID=UPI00216B1B11|nr:DUF3732 domain-containing protein [Cellulomonas sp. P24]MCR6491447.1 DUF3732 domain-containing protein [Cellulomonas sp. P24]
MQLVSLSLYSSRGQRETIPFTLGSLNVITGQSKTGKSVLVKLIDYCLGRSDVPTSAGKVEAALRWVGVVWQFADGGRAFVGRPLPKVGRTTNSQAMVRLGDETLQPPEFSELAANQTCTSMRVMLGERIGITESRVEPAPGSLRRPFRTGLGHAALLCLQSQDEISSSTHIFHRSDDWAQAQNLRDTLPYFLGAVPADQAALKGMLRGQQRQQLRLERDLEIAQRRAEGLDDELQSLLIEAADVGLTDRPELAAAPLTREELLTRLHRAAGTALQPSSQEPTSTSRTDVQDARRAAQAELEVAEDELDQLMGKRSLLLDESERGSEYADALEVQSGRLASINLLPRATDGDEQDPRSTATCPVCGQVGQVPDPTALQLRAALDVLDTRLRKIRRASPAKGLALAQVAGQIADAQGRVARARALVGAALSADSLVGADPQRRSDFVRGRIDAVLERAPSVDRTQIDQIAARIADVEQSVEDIQLQLSDDKARELLNSRLLGVGRDLTTYAKRLELEHSDREVRIDLSQLTIIADVDDVPVPLHRIGSAENWIGYHIASHLALHQSFIRHDRPVPRLLVIDQPSQGHYPSEMAKHPGRTQVDADEIAVRRLYSLIYEFVAANDGQFQVIVVDHANIDEPWFQDSIVVEWRRQDPDGQIRKLVPASWLTDEDPPEQS